MAKTKKPNNLLGKASHPMKILLTEQKRVKPKRLKRVRTKVTVELEFDHPEFIEISELMAKTRKMSMSKFYGQLIQAGLGSYEGNYEGKYIDTKVLRLEKFSLCP